jgi:hypothetical protein
MENAEVKPIESSWIGEHLLLCAFGGTVDDIPLVAEEMSIITSPSLTMNLNDQKFNFSANTCRFLKRKIN